MSKNGSQATTSGPDGGVCDAVGRAGIFRKTPSRTRTLYDLRKLLAAVASPAPSTLHLA